MPQLIDSHCHLHFAPYQKDLDAVLARMKEADVWAITVGTTIETSSEGIDFAEKHENVWATVGYHPEHFTSSFHDESEGEIGAYSFEELERLARSSKKIVAIGETGLDFFRMDENVDREKGKAIQEKAFREHIALADKLDLPVVIHCREALEKLAEVVKDEQARGKKVRGVVHCYTGTWEEAQPLLDLGLYISFTGIITFPPRKNEDPEKSFNRVIERMPIERLLIETDAPWLTPVPYRGQRNEPAYVKHVAEQLAKLRHADFEAVSKQTTENAMKLFGLH